MKKGQQYIHIHNSMITCTVLSLTNKGCEVKQVEHLRKSKIKSTIEYYNKQDFIGVHAFWKELQEN